MDTVQKQFTDDATGIPLIYAQLPSSFQCRARLRQIQKGNESSLFLQGMAVSDVPHQELFFQTGDSFQDERFINESAGTLIPHRLCSASEQLDEYAMQFISQPLQLYGHYDLPENRRQKLLEEAQILINRQLEAYMRTAQFSQVPVSIQCTETIIDGAMGVWSLSKNNTPMTLCSAITRIGYTIVITANVGLYAMPQNFGKPLTSWTIPIVIQMVSDGQPDEETIQAFARFVDSYTDSQELKNYTAQFEQQVTDMMLNQAAMSAAQNQSMINQVLAQQNAAWARTEAFGKSLSQDLDAFRAGLAANSAAMDSFHAGMHSMNAGTGFARNPETPDDRIQRWRHESMMGVNTYEREDGSTYEHSIQADRVFENNLDSNTHIGTENNFDDYVPDGWTELNRRK